MQLIRYQPWGAFDLVDRLLAGQHGQLTRDDTTTTAADWVPAVDIREEAGRFVIHADVPGVDPKDIEVSMEDGVLTLSGERKAESRTEQDGWKRVERLAGRFLRRFTLPEGTDAENISAHGSHGVLEIVIPKLAKLQPKKIQVKVN
ncbi:MAG TPA: Hsp20/alpha crystallin family protein [Gammaproteobacteria bacterium]|nr:Hsp20/alpha crystallin family protein [Gammaproteobacteria bacterium]